MYIATNASYNKDYEITALIDLLDMLRNNTVERI